MLLFLCAFFNNRMRLLPVIALAAWAMSSPAADPVPTRFERHDSRSKISSAIRQQFIQHTNTQHITRSSSNQFIAGAAPTSLLMRIDVIPDNDILAAILATGARIRHSSIRWHEVLVEATPTQAIALSQITAVHSISPAWRPFRHTTSPTIDEADSVIHTNTVRSAFETTGVGVTIGVMSDTINLTSSVGSGILSGTLPAATLTGTIPQLSDDLPSIITIIDPGSASGATDEGAAMMEEVYDLAPGATYAFASSGNSETIMADNIAKLQTAGCTIICDDVGFFAEPMFQDGPIAQAVDAFVNSGGIYLSAAGNAADQGILSSYVDVDSPTDDPHTPNSLPTGNDFHDWGIGGSTPGLLPITVTPSGSSSILTVTLEWNQPFHSYGLGAGSRSDYDMYLYNAPSAISSRIPINFSADFQGTSTTPDGDPVEIFQHAISGHSPTTIYLALDRYQGVTATFRIVFHVSRGSLSFPSPPVGYPAATIYGHPAATKALAIAAAPYSSPLIVEDFTSLGGWNAQGLPFYFNTSGSALTGAPILRNKPELTAPDGTSTSLSNFDPFFGTSAAVPHAAGAAALLWSIYPGKTNQEITTLLTSTAIDLTASPASSGPDAWSGYGLIDAAAAADSSATTITAITPTPSNSTVQIGVVSIQVTFSRVVTVIGTPTITLNTTPSRQAIYVSGSGTSTLLFSYTTQSGDSTHSASLDALNTAALSTHGSIRDSNGSKVKLTVPVGITAGSLASSHVIIDAAGPSLTISSTPTTSHLPTFTCTLTFSSSVTISNPNLMTIINGSLLSFSGSGSAYTALISATSPGIVSLSAPNSFALNSGNYPSFSASTSVTYDASSPTLSISAPASASAHTSIDVTFTFNESIYGFTQSDVVIDQGEISDFGGTDDTYTATILTGSPGTLHVNVDSTAAFDLAGNPLATSATMTIPITAVPSSDDGSSHSKCGLGGIIFVSVFTTLLFLRRRFIA